LSRLEPIAPRAGQTVELRFLCGLTEEEMAEALSISLATLKRDWSFAKAWLFRQLSDAPCASPTIANQQLCCCAAPRHTTPSEPIELKTIKRREKG
jgi:hypothetical protein